MKKFLMTVLVAMVMVLVVDVLWATTTLTTAVTLNFVCDYNKTGDLNTVQDDMSLTAGFTLASGTGANQANVLWKDTRTLADAANETLDIHDGTLTNAFGDTVTIDKLKLLYIKNKSADANMVIGAATGTQLPLFGTPATDTLKLRPGGQMLVTSPDAIGINTTTNSDLKITHDGSGSSTMDYDIVIVGVD